MRLVWALWTVEPVGVGSYLIINMLSNFCFLFLKKFDGGTRVEVVSKRKKERIPIESQQEEGAGERG